MKSNKVWAALCGLVVLLGSCDKTEKTVPVAEVTLNVSEITLTPGETQKLIATVLPDGAVYDAVVWASDDEDVAVVSEEGIVTGVAPGSAVVKATVAGFTAECAVTVTAPAKTWNIGDYYDVDGVKGIVVWTSDDKEHGKIISMTEVVGKLWATGSYNTGANSEEDGKANTEKVKDINSDLSHFPAFKWCVDLGTGWYLPAISEVYAFLNNGTLENAALSANGGDVLTDYYWSSTEALEESASTEALYGFFKGKDEAGSWSDFKDEPEGDMAVRAMLQF